MSELKVLVVLIKNNFVYVNDIKKQDKFEARTFAEIAATKLNLNSCDTTLFEVIKTC